MTKNIVPKYIIDSMFEDDYNVTFNARGFYITHELYDGIVYFICPMEIYHQIYDTTIYDTTREGLTLDQQVELNVFKGTNYEDVNTYNEISIRLIDRQKKINREKQIEKILK